MPRSVIAGLYAKSMFRFLRNYQNFFQTDQGTVLKQLFQTSYQHCMSDPISLSLPAFDGVAVVSFCCHWGLVITHQGLNLLFPNG